MVDNDIMVQSFYFRRCVPIFLLMVLSYCVQAQEPSTILLEISGLQEAEGNLYIAVYDSEDTWLGENTVARQTLSIPDTRNGELVKTEILLPQGEYALSIYHDTNNNGELDTNFIGIPREPVALSNNARPRFGPPKYKNAVFSLGAEAVVQRIDMADL